ncbi:MAG: hypothetical protein VKL42_20470 [Snowella sp.]|nr:hypothetical protein [Snowella sp.]
MAIRQPLYSKEEFAQRGDLIYQTQIRPQQHYRGTNTYAKSVSRLQRVLDIFWMFHKKGLTWEELLQLRILC